jgi:hypothetical protein
LFCKQGVWFAERTTTIINRPCGPKKGILQMRNFFLAYPKLYALRRELSWAYYRILLRVENPDARSSYENEAVSTGWSTREPPLLVSPKTGYEQSQDHEDLQPADHH